MEGCPTTVELRFAVDATEAPLAYPDASWPDPGQVEQLAVELAGPGLLATLTLPIGQARSWVGRAVQRRVCRVPGGHRRHPHAPTDFELARLPPADRYDPGPGLLVQSDDEPASPVAGR